MTLTWSPAAGLIMAGVFLLTLMPGAVQDASSPQTFRARPTRVVDQNGRTVFLEHSALAAAVPSALTHGRG